MTTNEKREILAKHCEEYQTNNCLDCVFHGSDNWCDNYTEANAPEFIIEAAYNKLFPLVIEEPEIIEPVHDIVNHPTHYCRENAMECIEEMETLFGKEVVKHFCLCNAWKYRYRSSEKNGEEDLKKSDWYIRKYKELCSNE